MKPRVPPASPEYLKFLAPFDTRIQKLALAARAFLLGQAPEASELIYDAYSAVTTGFSFTGRPSDSFIHLPVYSKWVNIGFNFGSQLDDPSGLLEGSGRWIRHVRINDASDLDRPALKALVRQAIQRAERPSPEDAKRTRAKSVVRAIYPKKRRPVK